MSQIYKNSAGGGGGTPITTINGDTGSITGASVTIYADNIAQQAGSSVKFVNSGTVSTFEVTDTNNNTIIGKSAGNATLSGTQNVGEGSNVFIALTSGSSNTSFGYDSGLRLTTGSNNTFLGDAAGSFLTTGSFDIIIGEGAGSAYTSSESSNIVIGAPGTTGESNTIRIGTQGTGSEEQNTAYFAGIVGNTVANQELVTINSATGQLGVTTFVGSPVSFQAYKTSAQTVPAGRTNIDTTIIFDTAISNTGAAYNTTTGVFTAPATGFYSFSVVAYFQSLNTAVGATQILLAYTGSVQSLRVENAGIAVAQTGTIYIASASWGMPMTAGDTIQMQPFVDGTGTYEIEGTPLTSSPFGTSSTFSGFRVS